MYLMTPLRIVQILVILSSPAWGQEQERNRPMEVEIPIPISNPRAVLPGRTEPLTPKQKAELALRNTISPQAIANRAIVGGLDHLWRNPEEWGGNPDAYAKRFAWRMGRMAVRESVQLSTDVAFGLDPRYDRCNCSGFLSRTGHAWRRVVVSRTDAGGEMFAVSTFAGAYVTPFITDPWYPPSINNWNHKWESGTTALALRGVTNMLREFWPDIRRKTRIPVIKVE